MRAKEQRATRRLLLIRTESNTFKPDELDGDWKVESDKILSIVQQEAAVRTRTFGAGAISTGARNLCSSALDRDIYAGTCERIRYSVAGEVFEPFLGKRGTPTDETHALVRIANDVNAMHAARARPSSS
jgi:hypothetical protein